MDKPETLPLVSEFAFLEWLEAWAKDMEEQARKAENLLIDQEMAFSVQPHMNDRCEDMYDAEQWRYCTRKRGHGGDHASGFNAARIRWK